MKTRTFILQSFSLSCLLAGILVLCSYSSRANDLSPNSDSDKDKKKTGTSLFAGALPKTNLSLDGFRYNGMLNSEFKLTANNTWNFKSVMTYKKGNVTYVLPYNFQVQQPANMQFHKLQLVLPLK
ncbi:MAG TPA: hypothetical protein VGE90_09400 [Chitinophaga sp.]